MRGGPKLYTHGTIALGGARNCMSEHQQDAAIWEKFFSNYTAPGVFVEMGALDGQTDSNTFAYEHGLNWTGVLIEANPNMCRLLYERAHRPRSTKLCTAVSNDSSPIHFQRGTWTTSFGSVDDIRKTMPSSDESPRSCCSCRSRLGACSWWDPGRGRKVAWSRHATPTARLGLGPRLAALRLRLAAALAVAPGAARPGPAPAFPSIWALPIAIGIAHWHSAYD